MNQKTLNKVFVWGFLFLYLLVACISFCHAVEFFNIGNVMWMSVALAFAFELGLALSLAAILLSDNNKKNTLPWILMIVLCLVQVIGNVYSVFKYISLTDVDYYVYLQKSLLFMIDDISQETVQVIISWIMGAILPVIALMMTEMVASNLKSGATDSIENNKETISNEPENDEDEFSGIKEAFSNIKESLKRKKDTKSIVANESKGLSEESIEMPKEDIIYESPAINVEPVVNEPTEEDVFNSYRPYDEEIAAIEKHLDPQIAIPNRESRDIRDRANG